MIDLIPIDPGNWLDEKKLFAAIENGLDLAADGAKVDFEVTVATWETDVQFTITKRPGSREIKTNSDIYHYVDEGTKSHVIVAKKGKALAFRPGGKAKSRPGFIGSNAGSAGGSTVFARRTRHPGIQPRRFRETIHKKWQKQLPITVQDSIDAAIK